MSSSSTTTIHSSSPQSQTVAMSSPQPPHRDMKVLSLGLPRTGSTSMAEALSILGYQGVHHTSKAIHRRHDWEVLCDAADASFPCLPSYTGVPFTRAQWDELYGPYEAATDAASIFSAELIRAYPEAKVILVERDYEKWHASVIGSLFPVVWSRTTEFSMAYIEPLVGWRGGEATRKLLLGLFNARTPEEAASKAREVHDGHAVRIREMVPPENLLEYKLGAGWGPLCEFLGCEVPDQEFPWLNEAAMLRQIAFDITVMNAIKAARILMPWVIGLGAVAAGAWWAAKR